MENKLNSKISSEYAYIDTAESLARLTKELHGAARVVVDVEADGLHHYTDKVCLIQLSFCGKNYIIDPLAGFALTGFFEVLAEKELILHGADYDLRMLKKTFGFRPKAPVFDTMLAAQVLGFEKIGLAALVEKFFGIVLHKGSQKSDWSRRPLTQALLDYAAADTKYLEAIAGALAESLRELSRVDWHRECCSRVVKSTGLPDKSEAKEAWRIKGSSRLPPQVLAFVRELWKWRDGEARRRDRPSFMIMHNDDILEIANWRVKNLQVPLSQGPAFLKRFHGEVLTRFENAVRIADSLPAAEWPKPLKKQEWPGEQPDYQKSEKLLAACKVLADALKVETAFLASRAALTAVARHQPRSIEGVMEVSGLMQWQAELLMPAIKSVLDG